MICAYEDCDNEFTPKTHNQKYCSDECCRVATNLKIKQKYNDDKNRKSGAERFCSTKGCKNKLSRYNPSRICTACENKKVSTANQKAKELMRNVIS